MSALSGCKKLLAIANLLNTHGIHIIGYHVPNTIVNFIIIMPLITMGAFALILCIENQSYGLFAISSSISIFIGCLSAGAIYICLAAKTKNLIKLFGSLKQNIERRGHISALHSVLYRKQNTQNEKLMKIIFWYAIAVQVIVSIPPLSLPILYLFVGIPSPDYWTLPYPISPTVPFNMQKPAVYYAVLLLPISANFTYFSVVGSFTASYITVCTYVRTFIKDIEINVSQLNEKLVAKKDRHCTYSQRNRVLLKEYLEFNVDCFDLMNDFKDIMGGPLFYQLLIYVLFVALYLLQCEEITNGMITNVLFNMCCLLTQMLFNYVTCHFASNLTSNSFLIGDLTYDLLWYYLPIFDQKLIAMNIKRAQIPYTLKGYNFLHCSLQSYLNLLQSSVSYYMVFRQFSDDA